MSRQSHDGTAQRGLRGYRFGSRALALALAAMIALAAGGLLLPMN